MPLRKTAIAVPEELLRDVDAAASARGESRSRFINHVLRAAVRAKRDAEITRSLNRIFADGAQAEDNAKAATKLDLAGSDWSDERW